MLVGQIIGGLAIGSIYVLVALGYTMIWRALHVLNFSQGDLLMLGAFIGYTFQVTLGLAFWQALLLTMLVASLIGVLYGVVIYPIRNRPSIDTMVVTIGIAFIVRNMARIIWGAEPLAMPPVFSEEPVHFLGARIPPAHLWILGISVVLVALLTFFFNFTRWGRAMRAAAQDRDTARLMGVPVFQTDVLTFVISTALAAAAGVLISPIYFITADMGHFTGLKAFLASTLGGFGDMVGALLGGAFMGVIENLGSLFISSGYKDLIAFVVMIIVLIALPQGIGGWLRRRRT